jgi:ribonuclease P protein component|tara:strand:+ start:330 stop:692 length:363 start_codon:yes stop_codon:yes gene_type:complete
MKSERNQNDSNKEECIYDKITKRPDYIRASTGSNVRTSSLFLQKFNRKDNEIPRYGITATKKVGIAVDRNKAKRRLRHAVKKVLPKWGESGYDYVVVATKKTNILPWDVIISDLERAFKE